MCDLCDGTEYNCDKCGQPCPFEYTVAPSVWHKVTDATDESIGSMDGGEGYLCLHCFVLLAVSKGVKNLVVWGIVPNEVKKP